MKMDSRSSIEHKLRQYVYLGNNFSIRVYNPPALRNTYFKTDVLLIGFQLIEDIVKKCEVEKINSIVPLLLKIKNEQKLQDERLLIFLLAVCARFNLKRCVTMIAEAYAGVIIICSNGLQLLQFTQFCITANDFLYKKHYLPSKPTGFGNGFRKAMNKWYLHRDPLLTTKQILSHKRYEGWTHKKIMNLIRLRTNNPSYHIFITHTMYGMKEVERLYKSKVKHIGIKNENDQQLKFIYNYLQQVNDMNNMNEETLQKEIELNKWGQQFEIIPQKMLNSPKILTSLIMHMPLKEILDKTMIFNKQKLFDQTSPSRGLQEYILRFNNSIELKVSEIHPIEPFIEFIKYSRENLNILKGQNDTLNSQVLIKTENTNSGKYYNDSNSQNIYSNSTTSLECKASTSQMTIQQENRGDFIPANALTIYQNLARPVPQMSINNPNAIYRPYVQPMNVTYLSQPINNQLNINMPPQRCMQIHPRKRIYMDYRRKTRSAIKQSETKKTSTPELQSVLLKFLSEDLITKTLEILKPSDHRILIVYDDRQQLKTVSCAGTRLFNVQEAIALLTLCLIFPEKPSNKPFIIGTNQSGHMHSVKIDYSSPLNHAVIQSLMFKTSNKNIIPKKRDKISFYPKNLLNVSRINNKKFDVFVFMGTNKMSFRNLKKGIKEYQAFLKKSVKIIILCFNGKHKEQATLKHQNVLLICGFDKDVGNIINSFLNNEF